jgi:hypothetical protein
MISRWITPVIYQPRISPLNGAEWGFGNLLPQWENQGGPGTDGQKILVPNRLVASSCQGPARQICRLRVDKEGMILILNIIKKLLGSEPPWVRRKPIRKRSRRN